MKKRLKQWFDGLVANAIQNNLDHYQRELEKAGKDIYQLQNMVAYMVHHTPASKATSGDWEKIKRGDYSPVGFRLLQDAGFVSNAVEMDVNNFVNSLRENGGA